MSQSANVRSVDALREFRAQLATFAEEARNALSSTEMEVRRTRDWLQRDQLTFWQAQVKRRNEQVSMARTELHRRRLSQQGSDAISDTEQKENLRLAERRLREAEEKVQLIKKWIPVLEHAINEYHSSSQPLGDRLTGSLVNSLSLLDRTVGSLEAYLQTAAPSMAPSTASGANAAESPAARSEAASSAPGPPSAEPAEPPLPPEPSPAEFEREVES